MKPLILMSLIALLVGCGSNESEQTGAAKNDPEHDTQAAIYSAAQDAVREHMKVPKSTVFPALPKFRTSKIDAVTLYISDSLNIRLEGDLAEVDGYYESANLYNAMLPVAKFKSKLIRNGEKWQSTSRPEFFENAAGVWVPEGL